MKLSPWLRFAAFFWLACVAWFVLLVAGVLANSARAETRIDEREPPPWHLPRFDGADDPRDQPPAGALEPPPVLDARGLYDLVITCFPSPTWWKPEIALEGRYETFTVGRAIEWEKVKEIYQLGLRHGMRLAAVSGVKGVYTDEDFARVRELALEARGELAAAGPMGRGQKAP